MAPRHVLIIPCFNEGASLALVLEQASAEADLLLMVDDGSVDQSVAMLEQWKDPDQGRILLRMPHNQGKTAALKAGMEEVESLLARGLLTSEDFVLLVDADGQHPIDRSREFCAALASTGVDMLVARRDLRGYSWLTRLGNAFFAAQASVLTRSAMHDPLCGMRAWRAGRTREVRACLGQRPYACELEMCISLPRSGWKLRNDFLIEPPHFRSNPNWLDAWQIFVAGFVSWFRP
jgi:glycosyltransferase involved in cell wall biosynthesis